MEQLLELALFAGAGGGILGGKLLGWRCVGAVEIEDYPRRVLVARQNDGCLDPFPIWDDVTTFRIDNEECRGYIESLRAVRNRLVVSGGFPCQDISIANPNGKGLEGSRSGLWTEMRRIIGDIRPRYAFVENSPMLTVRGGLRVVADLVGLGYCCSWGVVGADDAGLAMRRKRLWIVAYSDENEYLVSRQSRRWRLTQQSSGSRLRDREEIRKEHSRQLESRVDRIVDGLAGQMDRLAAIGNGQCPQSAALAWKVLNGK